MALHTVIVGNIGTVLDNGSWFDAVKAFREYRALSKSGVGRAGHEHVTWFRDGSIYMEYTPKQQDQETDEDAN
jgi:hypothetical protein